MRAALARHARRYSTTCSSSRLLALLQRNPELGVDDARTELRWMRDAVRQRPRSGVGSSPVSGSSDPEAALETMVQRRAAGEPLQYILGEYFGSASVQGHS